jgi:hypothetical protein
MEALRFKFEPLEIDEAHDQATCDKSFLDDHGRVALVWSNPEASDEALYVFYLTMNGNHKLQQPKHYYLSNL